MQVGTLGEWVGALATTAATIVALYLGARDTTVHSERQAARRTLHSLARARLQALDRWDARTEEPDRRSMEHSPNLDAESAAFLVAADSLSPRRARRAERLLREVYGDRSVNVARLYPERVDVDAVNPGSGSDGFGRRRTLTDHLLGTDHKLVVDGEPGPLRRRGAGDDLEERARLRRAFEALAKV